MSTFLGGYKTNSWILVSWILVLKCAYQDDVCSSQLLILEFFGKLGTCGHSFWLLQVQWSSSTWHFENLIQDTSLLCSRMRFILFIGLVRFFHTWVWNMSILSTDAEEDSQSLWLLLLQVCSQMRFKRAVFFFPRQEIFMS